MSVISEALSQLKVEIKIISSALKTVEVFSGKLNDEIQSGIKIYPCCLIHLDKFEPGIKDENGAVTTYRGNLFLYVGARNPQSQTERRDGALEILEDLRDSLHNANITDDEEKILISRMVWEGDEHLLSFPNQEIYAQNYTVSLPK